MAHATTLRLHSGEKIGKRLIGLPFLVAGLGAWWAIAHVENPDVMLPIVFRGLGTLFTLTGTTILFLRLETEIDRGTGTVTDVLKLFVPLWRKRRPLGGASRVVLEIEAHTNASANDYEYMVYAVSLRRPSGTDGIPLITETGYATARARALAVAEFLEMPFEDLSSDTPDDRAERPIAPPRPPPGRRIVRDEDTGVSTLRVRAPGFQSIHFLYLAVAVGFVAGVHFFVAPDFLGGITHRRARLFFSLFLYGGFAGVPALLLAVPVLRSLTERSSVDFDRTGLTIRRSWILGRSRLCVPSGGVAKVDLSVSSRRYREPGLREGRVVRVITRAGEVVELGSLLRCEEAKWLCDEIRRQAGG